MKIPNRVLGIEWDHRQVTVAECTRNGGGPQAGRVVTLTVPEEIAAAPPEERGRWLAGALASAGLTPGPAVAALPRGSALWRRIALPPGLGSDQEAVLEFQARRELPLPLEEVNAAWHADPDGTAATLGAVRRTLVDEIQALYDAAGCPLVALVPSAFAALAAAQANAGRSGGHDDWFLVDVGARESEIIWVSAGAVRLVRTTSVGHSMPGLVARLGGELERACRSIETGGAGSGELAGAVESGATASAVPTHIRLTNAGTNGLAGDLGERLGLPVGGLEGDGARPSEGEPGWIAIGAAWSMLEDAAVRLDLLKPIVGRPRPKPKKARRNSVLILAAVAGLCVLLAPGFYLDAVEAEAKTMSSESAALENGVVGEVRELIKRRRLLRSWQTTGRQSWIEIASALARAVPKKKPVYIESLTFRDGQPIRIQGAATGSPAVQDFVQELEKQPELMRVRLKDRKFNKSRKGLHKWDWSIEAVIVPQVDR